MSSVDRPDGVDLSREPLEPDKSLGQLFSEMSADLGTLMRKEVELAKLETKEEMGRAGKAAGMLGAAGFTAYMALLFISLAIAWWLDEIMHTALAFLVVAVVYGIAAAILGSKGRAQLKQVNPVPQQTVDTLKEDVQWAKAQKS